MIGVSLFQNSLKPLCHRFAEQCEKVSRIVTAIPKVYDHCINSRR